MIHASLAQLRRALDSRQISSVELATLFLDRIDALNPQLNAFMYRVQPLLVMLIPCATLIVAGISLAVEAGGGLYWLAATFVTGTFACMTNAWVLLVEIKR